MKGEDVIQWSFVVWAFMWFMCFVGHAPVVALVVYFGGLGALYVVVPHINPDQEFTSVNKQKTKEMAERGN